MTETKLIGVLLLVLLQSLGGSAVAQQVTGQDIDTILARADKLLEDAKAAYEDASAKNSVQTFIDAGFKLEEARIKYLVLQEIGSADKQKVAADRLRAVNQLSKLIHDGKVAVGGTPAEPAPLQPADPGPSKPQPLPKDPPVNPPAPSKAPVDVMKRAPVPDAAKQREAEKVIKDLFKEQYAKKTAADRKSLVRMLLDQAGKPQDDLSVLWVLCREAQDIAIQICDIEAISIAIEVAARVFDVDPILTKNTSLTSAVKMAKSPEEFSSLAEALIRLVDDLIRTDLYDSADKAVALATQVARKSNDSGLIARTTTRAKEVTEAKTLFQAMKSVLETQAKNPDDPAANLEIGRFLCFVKGSWDLGLRFIVKGSDPALKTLAEKELAFPVQGPDRVALADGWYDLADKDKSPLRKNQLLAHAKSIYEGALLDAVGVTRAKIEKRLDDLDRIAGGGSGIDLLSMLDLKKDVVSGQWALEKGCLCISSAPNPWSALEFPYVFPEEYDLKLTLKASDSFIKIGIVLPLGDHLGMIFVGQDDGKVAAIDQIDGRGWLESPAKFAMTPAKMASLVCSVRKTGLSITLDGKRILDWKDNSRIGLYSGMTVRNKSTFNIVGGTRLQISQARVIAVSGQGKRLK